MRRKKCWIILLGCLFLTGCHVKHDWTEVTCTEPEMCVVCGKTMGEAMGHDWMEATCTSPAVCADCGETKGEPLGHSWVEAGCLEPRICLVCGEMGEAPGHDWNVEQADCTTDKICNRCQTLEEKRKKHQLDEEGVCIMCGQQIGIPLTEYNIAQYVQVTPMRTVEGTNGSYHYYYRMEGKPINSSQKFHNVQILVKLYLTYDYNLELREDGALYGWKTFMLELDESGRLLEEYTGLREYGTMEAVREPDLIFGGYMYHAEGFCYDASSAELAQ